ncbi:hypothetical protein M409DRAFT_54831 [Zasmidium cellare ATCC 36951]|uniref:Uncharacterized protein n=1 Tax=Zasmidium cellare ATCC 36951 TaxID=1080233 RepID=A0A6A6CK13_ZASCE|nr:uncharacterized protein M409DRAFT_54831 [Zasmidium cellare ATCC 36951]KAF2166490.1 hypothetical protein M409DRAFT_54831 [Zasmidium cellare ATCC 36951]
MAKEPIHEQKALISEESLHEAVPADKRTCIDSSGQKFNYRPGILRTWALTTLLILTAVLFGLVQYAVGVLPHGTVRVPIAGDGVKHEWGSLVGRQLVSTSSSEIYPAQSIPTSDACPECVSSSSQEISPPTITGATPPSAYIQPSETITRSVHTSTAPATTRTSPAAYLASSETYTLSATPPSAYVDPVSSTTASSAYVDPVSTTTNTHKVGATPGPAYDFNLASQHEAGGGVVVYTWTAAQVFVGTYLPVLVAVFYRALWSVLNNHMALIDPFRQMNRANGARADQVLFSFYHSRVSILDIFRAIWRGRWGLGSSAIAAALTCILPALASEAIWVDTTWDCSNPNVGSNNPCPARMTVSVIVARVLQVLLALCALLVLLVIFDLRSRPTGLRSCPASIAGVACLVRHPSLERDFRGFQTAFREGERFAKEFFAGKRYRLGFWEDRSGVRCYGIRPVSVYEDDIFSQASIQVVPKVDAAEEADVPGSLHVPSANGSRASRWGFQEIALMIMIVGAFGVVLAYTLDYRDDGFNRFFNSNTFGPRFLLTATGTIIVHFWTQIAHTTTITAPFHRLSHQRSPSPTTIAFNPTTTPLLATFSALRARYFLAAAVATAALLAEALNIVISGVPFAPGQVHLQFLVSAYASLGILGVMVGVLGVVLVLRRRRREELVVVEPFTLAGMMSYVVGGRVLEGDGGVGSGGGRRYFLREVVLEDGERRVVVDGVDSLDG